MADYEKEIHEVVWMPVVQRHPMTGRRKVFRVLSNYSDRIVTKEQADKLNRHYNRKAAQGSLSME